MPRRLYAQTEGNPLFLREIVRFLEQQGVFRAPLSALPPAIRIPEGVKEVIGRRLNLLSAACNEMLALAAVIGRDFALDVLLHAAGRHGDDSLLDALDEALAAHVIEETTDGRYQFTHNLIRMTLYDELRTARRRQLHRAVGKAIEALHRADVDAFLPELARHFHAAGDIDRAIDYATRAGQRADALLAFEDAVQFFQAALDGIEQGQPDERRDAGCCCCWARHSARPMTIRVRWRLCAKQPRSRPRSAKPELFARAALAYEQAAWRRCPTWRSAAGDICWNGRYGSCREPTPRCGPRSRQRSPGRWYMQAPRRRHGRRVAGDRHGAATWRPGGAGDEPLLHVRLRLGAEHTEELIGYATEMLTAAEQAGNMEIVAVAYSWRLVFHLELGDIKRPKPIWMH